MPGDNPNVPSAHAAVMLREHAGGGDMFDNEAMPRKRFRRRGFPAAIAWLASTCSSLRCCSLLKPGGARFRNSAFTLSATGIMAGSVLLSAPHSFAMEGDLFQQVTGIFPLDHSAILALAIFGGAVSFSLLSAFWLIRERARIAEENTRLRRNYSGIRLERDRMASLLEVEDLSILIWNGEVDKPQMLGGLKSGSGYPERREDVLAFGKWLTPRSAMDAETAIENLRQEGQPFTLELATLAGTTIEAQGRVSGSQAFVRMILLDGTREALAGLTRSHQQLLDRFSVIERLFETMRSPVWIKARDGSLAYVNPAYASAVDCSDADQAVRDDRQLFDAKERELIQAALARDAVHDSHLPAVIAGDRRLMETHAVSNEAGSAGIAIDRSDVDAVRAELKYAIASQEQTFDHLASGVAIFDSRQRLQFYNSSFQQLWGLSASDLEGGPGNGDLLETMRSRSMLPEMPDWKRWKDGQLETYRSTETRTDHWHLPDGRTLRVIVNPQKQGGTSWVFENVTEELALRSNYNSLMRVQGETLDHLNEAVAVFGSDGKVRLTNPAFLKLWKFQSQETVEGRHIRDVSVQITSALSERADWDKVCLGVTGLDEGRADLIGRLEMKQGTVLDYHLVHLPEGQSMLTLADVTAAVNIERALQDRNEALEESDALKTRFIQHVSYELRAPLTSIAGFTEILAGETPGKLNAKQAEYLDYITRSSDVLKSLIDDILDLASIDAGAMQLDHQPIELKEIITECREGVADKLERFGITIATDISGAAEGFIGDPDRIRQILYNLVSNAVSVSPDGGSVLVEAVRKGDVVELAVSDQGPGVPEEKRESIFARFESGRGGEGRRGAGLGLSIVKSFVELHGGSVRVESGVNRGARFVCTFPFEPTSKLQAAE